MLVQTEGAWWVLQVSRVTSTGAVLAADVWAAPSSPPFYFLTLALALLKKDQES